MSNKKRLPKAARDHRANQLNPRHPLFYQSRGKSPQEATFAAQSVVGESSVPPDNPPDKQPFFRPLFGN